MKRFSALTALVLAAPAFAQPFVWSENAGWLNWNPANGSDQGPRFVLPLAAGQIGGLTGFVWGENIGWISLGSPGGPPYADAASQSGADFGVNIDRDGLVSGHAWGENVGWINFGPFDSAVCVCDLGVTDCADVSCRPARPRFVAGRLTGYAWGENIGWINLDDGTRFAGLPCAGDLDGNGQADVFDILAFLQLWNTGAGLADYDSTGTLNVFDIIEFLAVWNDGCPG